MKLIAVSQRIDVIIDRAERRDSLDQRISKWLCSAGYLPIPVPNQLCSLSFDESNATSCFLLEWLRAMKPAGILLSGGNDIGDCTDRDTTENNLLVWAKENVIPVLGTCRGMQMMAVWSGACLKPVTGHAGTRHGLKGTEFESNVNSYHNYSIKHCSPEFSVLAQSGDGEIEAIRHVSLPWEGWMWHPEREEKFNTHDISRMKGLFG